jgi:hypothetical protein
VLNVDGQPVDQAAVVALSKRIAASSQSVAALGHPASGQSGQGAQFGIPGSVSPDQQLEMALAAEIGFLYLDRTRIRPIGFAVGEFIYSLSLAPGEEVTIDQKTFSKRESTFEDLND